MNKASESKTDISALKESERYKYYISRIKRSGAYYKAFEKACKKLGKDQGNDLRENLSEKELLSTKLYLMCFAPVIISFVKYVLTDAESKGIKRLYFLSRDGYQMYLAAQKVKEIYGSDIELKYLNVSRFSMRVPGYKLDIDSAVESLCTGGIDVTAKRVVRRSGISDEECETVLKETGLYENRDRILNYREIIALKDLLKGSTTLKESMLRLSDEAYGPATSYLAQEGLLEGKSALVDSGWVGTQQEAILRLLKSINKDADLCGYYFGMYEYPEDVRRDKDARDKYKTFYFSPKKGLRRKVRFSNSLFEAVVTSDEGMTVGYKEENESYVPVKKEQVEDTGLLNGDKAQAKEDATNTEIVEINLRALKYLLEELEPDALTNLPDIKDTLGVFMSHPTEIELACYGDIEFSDDILDGNMKKIAADLTAQEIWDQRFFNKLKIIKGKIKREIKESGWLEGSAVKRSLADESFNAKEELIHIRFYKCLIYLRKTVK